jgi:5-methylcytosine-specific restriction endonuclease McrA
MRGEIARAKVDGTCHICGNIGPLTFEHLPPESAGNDGPVRVLQGLEIEAAGHDPRLGRKHQKGAGASTLCGSCNNKTGAWYGGARDDGEVAGA